MKHDDGGPAYPTREVTNWNPAMDGMSLLDAFAMEVLPAVYGVMMREMKENDCIPEDWRDGIAADAYKIAAAMVAAKRRREGGVK